MNSAAPAQTIRSSTAFVIAATTGAALWLASAALSGEREAWDGEVYWTVAYPHFGMLPVGLVMFAALGALPAALASYAGKVRLRRAHRAANRADQSSKAS